MSGTIENLHSLWPPAILMAEVLCVAILSILYRNHFIPSWILGVLLLLHYRFWVPIFWSNVGLFVLCVLVLLLPAVGVVWMLCINRQLISSVQTRKDGPYRKWTLATAALALAALLVIWFPGMGHSLTRAQDMKSITIQLSRGPCRGACASYTITMQGNGTLEYIGKEYVKIVGPQSDTISEEHLVRILQSLDRVRFSALEDRAFMYCFDTPSVSVSVTVDGQTRRVVSDASCTGAKSGIQAAFVRAADEIDTIVGSDQWTKCGGQRCRK
jgi:hypothetical protein